MKLKTKEPLIYLGLKVLFCPKAYSTEEAYIEKEGLGGSQYSLNKGSNHSIPKDFGVFEFMRAMVSLSQITKSCAASGIRSSNFWCFSCRNIPAGSPRN
ncbi:hypothetical protein IOC57_09350 [Bacillus sp. SD075]|uniref:hypothetical protein n=1 Tax=Bacillus sp. SD075 TaxID=2781732 RepID=UPI001A97B7B4|nr:hypothetical protein [Bacillus sp. SD075]MBO0997952.1 hypothetical protein [Bacillus sp. SD075]